MTAAIIRAIEDPHASGTRVVKVPEIRASAPLPSPS